MLTDDMDTFSEDGGGENFLLFSSEEFFKRWCFSLANRCFFLFPFGCCFVLYLINSLYIFLKNLTWFLLSDVKSVLWNWQCLLGLTYRLYIIFSLGYYHQFQIEVFPFNCTSYYENNNNIKKQNKTNKQNKQTASTGR